MVSAARSILSTLQRCDWPVSYRELRAAHAVDEVTFVAALASLRLDGSIRSIDLCGTRFYEVP